MLGFKLYSKPFPFLHVQLSGKKTENSLIRYKNVKIDRFNSAYLCYFCRNKQKNGKFKPYSYRENN